MSITKVYGLAYTILLVVLIYALFVFYNENRLADSYNSKQITNKTSAYGSYDKLKDKVCVSLSFDLKGNLDLTNACQSAQLLTQANIKFVSQDTNGHRVILNKFYNNTSGLCIEFSSGGSNQQIGKFTAENQALVINGNTTLTFIGSALYSNSDPFDYIWANKTLDLSILGDNKVPADII